MWGQIVKNYHRNKKYNAPRDKLYGFIDNLITILEEDIAEIKTSEHKTAMLATKNTTETMAKLVGLIIQLNKLVIEEEAAIVPVTLMKEEDKFIINSFLQKRTAQDEYGG